MKRTLRALCCLSLCSLCSCEWLERQRAFNASPEGQALQAQYMTQWGLQMQQQSHQNYLQRQQHLHEQILSRRPLQVNHYGSFRHSHSGNITIRHR